MRLSSLRNML